MENVALPVIGFTHSVAGRVPRCFILVVFRYREVRR
jgi:hypothetical protein